MDELKNKGSSSLTLRWPYLIILGDTQELVDAKTGAGLVQWCPEKVAGQLRFDNCLVDLGVSDLSISEAIDRGVKSVVIGVAPTGGQINQRWICLLEEAAAAGLDLGGKPLDSNTTAWLTRKYMNWVINETVVAGIPPELVVNHVGGQYKPLPCRHFS